MIQGLDGAHPQVFRLHDVTLRWTTFQVKSCGLSKFSAHFLFIYLFFSLLTSFLLCKTAATVDRRMSNRRRPLLPSSSDTSRPSEGDRYLCLPFVPFARMRHVTAACAGWPPRCTLTSPRLADWKLCSCHLRLFCAWSRGVKAEQKKKTGTNTWEDKCLVKANKHKTDTAVSSRAVAESLRRERCLMSTEVGPQINGKDEARWTNLFSTFTTCLPIYFPLNFITNQPLKMCNVLQFPALLSFNYMQYLWSRQKRNSNFLTTKEHFFNEWRRRTMFANMLELKMFADNLSFPTQPQLLLDYTFFLGCLDWSQ